MGKLWMRAGIQLSPPPVRTCQSRVAVNLFPLRCITSCVLPALMECTPDICQDIPLPMGVFECRSSWQLRSSIPSMLVLLSPCSEGRQREATRGNGNPHLCEAAIDLQIRALGHALCRLRLRFPGGGNTAALAGRSALSSAHSMVTSLNRKQNSAEDILLRQGSGGHVGRYRVYCGLVGA